MLFSSNTFLFQFLPATVLAFAAARRHSPRAGIMVLVGASLFFYGAWRPVYLLLFAASVAVNFALGLRMEDPLRRRGIGTFGVALNLAGLCYFKYTNFIFDSLNTLTGAPLPFVNIILPLGISFFHLPADCLSGRCDARRQGRARHRQLHFVCVVLPASDRGPPGASRRDDSAIQARPPRPFRGAGGAGPCDLRRRPVQEGGDRRQSGAVRIAGVCASRCRRRRHHALGVARDTGLYAANLFRLLRLFRHGDRARAVVRDPAAGEFSFTLPGDFDHRILAALAHHVVALPARLPLHSARRQPAR